MSDDHRAQDWNRREFVSWVTAVGTAGLLGPGLEVAAAEPPPETRTLRIARLPAVCEAPAQVAEGLLRGEGFSDVQYVADTPLAVFLRLASGEIDLAILTALAGVMRIDAGDAIVFLAGVHVGCFELIGNDRVRAIRDLKGKVVVVPALGTSPHALVATMATYVGLDPRKDITWAVHRGREAMQRFIDGKADAFMGYPPEPQELRARKIGHVVVNTTTDRPWSQYFCCMLVAHRELPRKHPSATKRAIRAILKAIDVCALEPDQTARLMVDRGYTDSYDLALKVVQEMPFGTWRQHDAEDAVRFFALRLHEAGLIKSTPQKIIAQGTDWRFLNELKKELKG
jgi:NitT/TauT family transport system substrate-binding protein